MLLCCLLVSKGKSTVLFKRNLQKTTGMLPTASYSCTAEFHCQEEILSLAEFYTEHRYLRLSFKVHSLKELAGFINEPADEAFLCYIPGTEH